MIRTSLRRIALALAGSCTAFAAASCAQLRTGAPTGDAGTVATGATDASADAGTEPSPFEIVRVFARGDELRSIWGVDDKTLFAVGSRGLKLLLQDGEWTRTANEPGRDYYQVWGTAYDDVYAVGEILGTHKGIIQHWDGVQWSDEYLAPTPIYGIYSDGIVVFAVSTKGRIYGKAVRSTDWAQRTQLVDPEPSDFNAIVGNGGTNVTLVSSRRIHHTTSLKYWAWLEPALDDTIRFSSAWAKPGPETDVFLGTNYLGVAWMYGPGHVPVKGNVDASLLTEPDASVEHEEMAQIYRDETEPNAADLYMRGMSGAGNKTIFVGDLGRIYMFDVITGDMTRITSPVPDRLYGVWTTKDSVWIVGSREVVLHGPMP